MNDKIVLNKLPQELVNQIAAGEVIERPSSVLKELVDNSIDAKATKIFIKVTNGGIDNIEVSDNGVGIPKENLEDVFKAHTTSKISSLEDLNNLLTMGFRGEALSTIVSVSSVKLISKYEHEDIGNEISYSNSTQSKVKSNARQSGTLVSVSNIFENIPARKKFLKSGQTEYKKILEILIPYFLIYPNIHFTLQRDLKTIYDLKPIPNSRSNSIEKERVQAVLKDSFVERALKLFYDGNGTKISGYVGHPSDHQKKATNQYLFVNRRPIRDSGISRAVYQGMERYIPHGEKIPYILLLDINPDLIDVNVHPRKEEVRFLNPFRIYSSVEEAVKKSVEGATSYRKEEPISNVYIPKEYTSRDISFKDTSVGSVRDSLLFSKEALEETQSIFNTREEYVESTPFKPQELDTVGILKNIYQIFNKYILVEFEDDILWVIDQHAAAERITFEKFKKNLPGQISKQKFLVPQEINISPVEGEALEEIKDFFFELGFEYEVKDSMLNIYSSPVEFVNTDFRKFFDEIFSLSDDIHNISKEILRLKDDLYATMACHGSVRSGQMLHREGMIDIYKKLIKCENPYSCPHGRPAVWKLKLSDIDMNFERTY